MHTDPSCQFVADQLRKRIDYVRRVNLITETSPTNRSAWTRVQLITETSHGRIRAQGKHQW